MRCRRALRLGLASLACLGAIFCLGATPPPSPASPASIARFADADDPAAVVAGKSLYMRACAGCHGRSLQGQPLWQLDDGPRRRAPAQDDTGHTWQHSDEAIFQMIKRGRFPDALAGAASFMPAFAGRLGDDDILKIMAFIKARWSIGLRAAQATLNPGMAGMPPDASRVDWTLPPSCAATQRQWRATSR